MFAALRYCVEYRPVSCPGALGLPRRIDPTRPTVVNTQPWGKSLDSRLIVLVYIVSANLASLDRAGASVSRFVPIGCGSCTRRRSGRQHASRLGRYRPRVKRAGPRAGDDCRRQRARSIPWRPTSRPASVTSRGQRVLPGPMPLEVSSSDGRVYDAVERGEPLEHECQRHDCGRSP